MDQTIDGSDLSSRLPDSTFFKDLVSLNGSSLLCAMDQMSMHQQMDQEHHSEPQVPTCPPISVHRNPDMTCNLTANLNNDWCDSSLQLLDKNRFNCMDTCLTPSLQMKANVSQRNNLFLLNNKRNQLMDNSCSSDSISESKENMVTDCNIIDNTLGLSPVKKFQIQKEDHRPSSTKSFSLPSLEISDSSDAFEGIQINDFSTKEQQIYSFNDQSFKSFSKCSDFELREEIKVDNTFRSPNCNFENKSIDVYFRQQSEPINSFKSSDESMTESPVFTSKASEPNFCPMDESFNDSYLNQMNLADSTLDIARKVIDNKKSRKRKSTSLSSTQLSSHFDNFSFAPSVNSTRNSGNEDTKRDTHKVIAVKEDNSSGFGTFSVFTHQTHANPDSKSIQTFQSPNSQSLNLNQLLVISPNILSLSIGCFVEFKLNYLKVRNLSPTSFSAEVKVKADIDTLNSLDVGYPKQSITIPPFFQGLLSDELMITPLKSGSFEITFEVYPKIENINLPISPISINCSVKVEELAIKRPFYTSESHSMIEYNLFEGNRELQTINLLIPNKNITNEIPLRLDLEPNYNFSFEPIYRHPDSAIHSFRCLNANTIFLTTKTQFEMKIPIRIEDKDQLRRQSSLSVSIDSAKSHVLAIIQLKVIFWPKKQLIEPWLQCSETTIMLSKRNKVIHFRNKSKDSLIGVTFRCFLHKTSADHLIRLSAHKLMIKPREKVSLGLMVVPNALTDRNGFHLLVTYDSGSSKSFSLKIPIQVL